MKKMAVCANCGRMVEDGVKLCARCETRSGSVDAPAQVVNTPQRAAGSACLLVSWILGFVLFFSSLVLWPAVLCALALNGNAESIFYYWTCSTTNRVVEQVYYSVALLAVAILSLIAWKKRGAKRALAAAIINSVAFSVPCAILCFIGRRRLKKTKAGAI
jgi:hypothetical protein